MVEPILQRLGGTRGVARLTFRFYDLVLASDRLRPFFDGVDMQRLIEHQAAFIVSLLGGKPSWNDGELVTIHANLEIGESEVDEMVRLLAQAIAEEGHPESEADRLLQHFRRIRDRLVGTIGGGSPAAA